MVFQLIGDFMTNFDKLVFASLGLMASGYSAAAIDLTELTGTKTDIAAVGAAVFGVMVAIKLTKWVRRAL
jgi:hypothetical protein